MRLSINVIVATYYGALPPDPYRYTLWLVISVGFKFLWISCIIDLLIHENH